MAASSSSALDELVHSQPGFITWWVDEQGGQPMDENMLHPYLSESPFFDHTTKNGIFMAQINEHTFPVIHDRHRFEDALSRQNGQEYMIVAEPKPAQDAKDMLPKDTTGIWNIRKQDRRKEQMPDGRVTDELTTLETYYTLGQNLYKAASVADTVGNRLLVAQRHMQAFLDTASALPSFDPAMGGYYYLKPSNKPAATTGSTPGTPSRSREGSVAAGTDSQSVRSGSVDLSTQAGGDPSSSILEDRLLRESLAMSVQFGDEYMDENPLIGEPGKFSFTSSTAAVKKRKADEEAAVAKAKAEREARSLPVTPRVEKAPAPPSVMTEAKATKTEKDRKGTKMGEKARRKKSKGNALSPITPGAGPSSSS